MRICAKKTILIKKYVLELEKQMGFHIKTIQVDNGYEFVNDEGRMIENVFEKAVKRFLGVYD